MMILSKIGDTTAGITQAMISSLGATLPLANAESGTRAWFALKFGPSTFGVFDAFQDEAGRSAHLNGPGSWPAQPDRGIWIMVQPR